MRRISIPELVEFHGKVEAYGKQVMEDNSLYKTLLQSFASDEQFSGQVAEAAKAYYQEFHGLFLNNYEMVLMNYAWNVSMIYRNFSSEVVEDMTATVTIEHFDYLTQEVAGFTEEFLEVKEHLTMLLNNHNHVMPLNDYESENVMVMYDNKKRNLQSLTNETENFIQGTVHLFDETIAKLDQLEALLNKSSEYVSTNAFNYTPGSLASSGFEIFAPPISGEVYDLTGEYGGNQMEMIELLTGYDLWGNVANLTEAQKAEGERLRAYLKSKFPDWGEAKLDQFAMQLTDNGCTYVAFCNTLVNKYIDDPEAFEDTFGFPLYVDGKLNYNQLILDFYCDTYDVSGKFLWFEMEGEQTSETASEYRFQKYLDNHDINNDVIIREGWFGLDPISASKANYEKYSQSGQVIIIISPVQMHYPDGSPYPSEGVTDLTAAHAMTIIGMTEDGGFLVSSWGKQFVVTAEDLEGYSTANLWVVEYD